MCQPSWFHWKEHQTSVRTDMSLLQWTSRAVCTERKRQPSCLRSDDVYYSVPAQLFSLKESASRAVCTEMSLLQCTSRAVCTDRKRQPSCLCWDEFTTVYQPSCFYWKKAPAWLFVLNWVYYSVLAELFALKESASRAVCTEMCLLQCTSQAVFTERKCQPSCLQWNEFTTVYHPSCFH